MAARARQRVGDIFEKKEALHGDGDGDGVGGPSCVFTLHSPPTPTKDPRTLSIGFTHPISD